MKFIFWEVITTLLYAKNTIDETIAKCLGRKENLLYYFKSEIDKNYIINCARPVKILKDWSETDA